MKDVSPQLENGYTSLANEIVEQLAKTQLSGYESRYLWVLWRCTYGWHKTEDRISNSQFVEKTGLKKQHLWRTESNLIKRKIVTKNGYKISFNKNYSQWIESDKLPKKVTVTNSGTKVTNSATKVTKNGAHKRNPTKEILQKKQESDVPSQDIVDIIDSFKVVNPSYRKFFGNTTQRAAIERLIPIHSKEKLLKVIPSLSKSNGMRFFPKITTPLQLEDKWAELESQWKRYQDERINNNKVAFV